MMRMRTTLTIDDDLLQQARQRALSAGRTFGDVVNQALRRGLSVAEEKSVNRVSESTIMYGDPKSPAPDLLQSTDDELAWLRQKAQV